MINARVEAAGLMALLKKKESLVLAPVRRVVANNAKALEGEMKRLTDKAVSTGRGNRPGGVKAGKGAATLRSRPGQPPRKDSGRLQKSIGTKILGDGTRAAVSVNADDGRGNRYPWMLESGTKHVKKRPFAKKAQRKIKKKFVRELVEVVRQVTRD